MTAAVETGRDYAAQMNAAIEEMIPDGDYVAPIVATQLVERLRREDPALLAGWLDLRAPAFLADVIARRSNSLRQAARIAAPRRAFAEAAQAYADTADVTVLRVFSAEYVIDERNTRRQVAQMTGADHLFVADRYADTEKRAKLEKAFHRAVAKKVGDRVTTDVFTEEQYLAMYQSVTGHRQAPRDVATA